MQHTANKAGKGLGYADLGKERMGDFKKMKRENAERYEQRNDQLKRKESIHTGGMKQNKAARMREKRSKKS